MKRAEPPGDVFVSTVRRVCASSGREHFINATLIPLYQRPQPQSSLSGYNTRSIIHRSVEQWTALPMEEYVLHPEAQQQTLEEAKEEAEGEKEMASQSETLEERRNRRG